MGEVKYFFHDILLIGNGRKLNKNKIKKKEKNRERRYRRLSAYNNK